MGQPIMKPFHRYRGTPVIFPQRYAEDYTREESESFQETFRAAASDHRRGQRNMLVMFGVAVLCWLPAAFMQKTTLTSWFSWAFAAIILLTLVLSTLERPLICPACRNALNEVMGPFCPECGARAVRATDGKYPECGSCKATLSRGRKGGRRYRIRACTHCGVMLDDQGI